MAAQTRAPSQQQRRQQQVSRCVVEDVEKADGSVVAGVVVVDVVGARVVPMAGEAD